MKRAREQINIPHAQVRALIEHQVIRPPRSAAARWRRRAGLRAAKLIAIAIDRPRPLNRDIVRFNRENQPHISIAKRGIARERHRFRRVILFSIRTAEQFSARRNVQRHIAFDLDRADHKHARRHQHRAAVVLVARINRRLQRSGVECGAIAFRAEIANIIYPRAQVVFGRIAIGFRGVGRSRKQAGADRCGRNHAQPIATREGLFVHRGKQRLIRKRLIAETRDVERR